MSRSIALPGSWINQQIRICGIEDWFKILIAPLSSRMISKPSSSLIKSCPSSFNVENLISEYCIKSIAYPVVATTTVAVKTAPAAHAVDFPATGLTNNTQHIHLHLSGLTSADGHFRDYPMNEPTYCRDTGRRIGVCACPKCLPTPPKAKQK